MDINEKYRSINNLLSIDDIISSRKEIKRISNPKWGDNNMFDAYQNIFAIGTWCADSIKERGTPWHTEYKKNYDNPVIREYFYFNKQKLCFLKKFHDKKMEKPYIFQIRKLDEEGIHSEVKLHGESLVFSQSGKILFSGNFLNGWSLGIQTSFFKNGQIRSWDYHKNNGDYNTWRSGLSFGFWSNGNLRFISKFNDEDEWERGYLFWIFDENEELIYHGERNKVFNKQRYYYTIYQYKNFLFDQEPHSDGYRTRHDAGHTVWEFPFESMDKNIKEHIEDLKEYLKTKNP